MTLLVVVESLRVGSFNCKLGEAVNTGAPDGTQIEMTDVLGPSFVVSQVHEKLDADGVLVDEITKVRLQVTLGEFAAWARSQGPV